MTTEQGAFRKRLARAEKHIGQHGRDCKICVNANRKQAQSFQQQAKVGKAFNPSEATYAHGKPSRAHSHTPLSEKRRGSPDVTHEPVTHTHGKGFHNYGGGLDAVTQRRGTGRPGTYREQARPVAKHYDGEPHSHMGRLGHGPKEQPRPGEKRDASYGGTKPFKEQPQKLKKRTKAVMGQDGKIRQIRVADKRRSNPQPPRKQSNAIIMGEGKTPQAGKPKQGGWAALQSHGTRRAKSGQYQPHSHRYGTHGHGTVSHAEREEVTGRVVGDLGGGYEGVTTRASRPRKLSAATTYGPSTPHNVPHGGDPITRRTEPHIHKPHGAKTKPYNHSHAPGRVHRDVGKGYSQIKNTPKVVTESGEFRKRWAGKAEDPHGGQSHGHLKGNEGYHNHTYGTHAEAKPLPDSVQHENRGARGYGGSPRDEEHKRKFGYAAKAPDENHKHDHAHTMGAPGAVSAPGGFPRHGHAHAHVAGHAPAPDSALHPSTAHHHSHPHMQKAVSPHNAPFDRDPVSKPHTMRIARRNAEMNAVGRNVMGAGDLHAHRGKGAHGHPDAWDADDNMSHTHKALRKADSDWKTHTHGNHYEHEHGPATNNQHRGSEGRHPYQGLGNAACDTKFCGRSLRDPTHHGRSPSGPPASLQKAVRLATKEIGSHAEHYHAPTGVDNRGDLKDETKHAHLGGSYDHNHDRYGGGAGYRGTVDSRNTPTKKAVMPPAELPDFRIKEPNREQH